MRITHLSTYIEEDANIIHSYFNDSFVRKKMEEELGYSGTVTVNWEDRVIVAQGVKASKQWDLDQFLSMLKRQVN